LRLAFHGTPEANVDSICKHSLDPARRAGQAMGKGEYFGLNFLTSLRYCRRGTKMLVFACLMDPDGITKETSEVLVIHLRDRHIPLFAITFQADTANGGR
jgi:hypothetical protein